MPVSPTMAEGLAEPMLRLYEEAEFIMLRKVADRLRRGITEPGWAEEKLLEIQRLQAELEAALRPATAQGRDTFEEAVRKAHNRGQAAALGDLEQAGAVVTRLGQGVDEQALQALIVEGVGNVQATHPRILRTTQDAYRETVYEAVAQEQLGVLTRREAAQRVLDRLLGRGITGFIDAAGHRYDLASYVEMATRTASARAAIDGHLSTLTANEQELVQVSDHAQECPLCRPWEGKVLSIGGRGSDQYPPLSEAEAAGLFHPGCRHSLGAYVEGFTSLPTGTEDPEGDQARQRQRYLERQIREAKRRQQLALDAKAKKAAGQLLQARQARLREHLGQNPFLKRDSARESIGRAR